MSQSPEATESTPTSQDAETLSAARAEDAAVPSAAASPDEQETPDPTRPDVAAEQPVEEVAAEEAADAAETPVDEAAADAAEETPASPETPTAEIATDAAEQPVDQVAADAAEQPVEEVAAEEATAAVETPVDEAADAAEETPVAPESPAPAETPAETPPAGSAVPIGGAPSAGPATAPAGPGAGRPGPRPVPRPAPRPQAPAAARPGVAVPSPAAAPVVSAAEAAQIAAASAFGRVDDDGTVYVREASGERAVGQFPGVSEDEAKALYIRRFLDLQAKVTLFESRLATAELTVKEIDTAVAGLVEETAEPAAVGDLDGLRARVEALRTTAESRRAEVAAERAAAKAAALAARTQIVEAAEGLAAQDPARVQWKPAGEQLRQLLDQWKQAQSEGPRLDRPDEEALWKRFSHARTTFDRERRHYFAELEQRNASAKLAKESLVAEAERLSSSTDWGATAAAYRDLMARWKLAGRASRRDDDALWERFRAAQDVFFSARDAATATVEAEYVANLQVKEELLAQAEALLPVTDLDAAKKALRGLQDRWEAAGKVPRADVQRVEGRMRAVETAVRDAEQAQWKRSNPETRARAEGAAAQLEAAIAALESDLAAARAKGNEKKVADLESAIAARRSWLEQVVRAAEDSRG